MPEEPVEKQIERSEVPSQGNGFASPFFSVIMPVYGTEEFIADAIESVLAQDFTNWELILVDDASPDGAIDVAQQYADSDKRLRIVHHETNKGLSESRNTGIRAARGKYIWFADSDDFFDADLLQRANEEIEATNADVVMFGLVEEYFDEKRNYLYDHEVAMEAYHGMGDEWHRKIIDYERDTCFGYSCTKVYSADVIEQNGLSFETVRLIEDVLFNIDFFSAAKTIAVLDNAPYHYRKIDGRSLTNANSYSAQEYYKLHARRVSALMQMLIRWDVFDDRARAILGSLYGRYVLSALERTYHGGGRLDPRERKAFAEQILSSELYSNLIPRAKADNSKALSLSLSVLKTGNSALIRALAKTMNAFRNNFYSMFTRLRSER